MSEINLKLKSYDELIFEITTLNTNKYLLEQKVNKQKKILDKIKEKIKENNNYLLSTENMYLGSDDELLKTAVLQLINNNLVQNDEIIKLLEEIK